MNETDSNQYVGEEYKELVNKVIEAKRKLKQYCEELQVNSSLKGQGLADIKVGGREGAAVLYSLAAMDANGDGKILMKEHEEYQETSKETIEKVNNLLLNTGVIAALILSIFYEFTISGLEVSDASRDYFGVRGIAVLKTAFVVLMTSNIMISLLVLYMSLRLYTYLSFWLSTVSAQMRFLDNAPLVGLSIASQWVIYLSMFAIPCGAAVQLNPGTGLFSLIICFISYLLTHYFEYKIGFKCAVKLANEEIFQLLGVKTKEA